MAMNCRMARVHLAGGRTNLWSVLNAAWLSVVLMGLASGCSQGSSGEPGASASRPSEPIVEPVEVSTAAAAGQGSDTQQAELMPKIQFESLVYDFGEVGPYTKHTGRFEFTNVGTAPLTIIEVRTCCGVSKSGVENGQVYQPGESGVLELGYTSAYEPGSMMRTLSVKSTDPERPDITLTIKAQIVERVACEPERLRLFLNKENAGVGNLTLTSLDGRPFSISSFRVTGSSITADFDPDVEATQFVLELKSDMARLQRNIRGQISIDLTHPECANVRVLYDVLPEFTIRPPQVTLFNIEPGKAVRREIWILSNYTDDFEVESVSSEKGFVTLVDSSKIEAADAGATETYDLNSITGTRYQLVVEILPPEQGDNAVLSDKLNVKIKDGDTLSIDCRGFY